MFCSNEAPEQQEGESEEVGNWGNAAFTRPETWGLPASKVSLGDSEALGGDTNTIIFWSEDFSPLDP